MVTILYCIFISIVIFIFISILPKIKTDISEIIKNTSSYAQQGQEFIKRIEDSTSLELGLDATVGELLSRQNLESIGQAIIGHITNAGIVLTKFFIAMILSYIFIIERKKINDFLQRIRQGNFSFLYDEWAIIAQKMGK